MSRHRGGSRSVIIRPVVDRELCMGSGQCNVYAPNSFTLDAELKAQVIDPSGDPLDTIRSAVEACPMGALQLVTAE